MRKASYTTTAKTTRPGGAASGVRVGESR